LLSILFSLLFPSLLLLKVEALKQKKRLISKKNILIQPAVRKKSIENIKFLLFFLISKIYKPHWPTLKQRNHLQKMI